MTDFEQKKTELDNSNILIVAVGVPCSGKSSYIKNLGLKLDSLDESNVIVKMNDYINENDPDVYEQVYNRRFGCLMRMVKEHMNNQVKNIIVDSCNINKKYWIYYANEAKSNGYRLYFMFPSFGLLYYPHEFINNNLVLEHINKDQMIVNTNMYYDYMSSFAFIMSNKDVCGVSPEKWLNFIQMIVR